MLPDPQAFADSLVVAIRSALAPVQATLAAVQAQVTQLEAKWGDVAIVRERLATLEARPLVPGPPGPAGQDGVPGKDGTPGLTYLGVYQDGKGYDVGDVTTWAGSAWHCHTATTAKPGDGSPDWQLMVKRGRDK